MIKQITLLILNFFDFFHKKKIFKYLKDNKLSNIDVLFDVGAHKGETIISFVKNLNIKKIYSFEASSISFDALSKNLKKIKLKIPKTEIKIENLALGSSIKDIVIKHFSESSSSTIKDINTSSKYFIKKKNYLFNNTKIDYFKKINVKQTTIDFYMDLKKISKIDLLKIDTEGYEYEIILGGTKNLRNIKLILFEHHYDNMIFKEYKFKDINNFLLKNNFKQVFKIKMPFRKTFEYIYQNKSI
jgi:FkbM family methyltransferase